MELKDGPIHDVKWAPNGEHFVAIHGFMPAKTTLFDKKCKPIYDFGSGPRNTVEWSPFSRFLVIGGFGNLPGDIEFYDKKADGKCKIMGKVRHSLILPTPKLNPLMHGVTMCAHSIPHVCVCVCVCACVLECVCVWQEMKRGGTD